MKFNDPDHLAEFKHQRNIITDLMNRERRGFYPGWVSHRVAKFPRIFKCGNFPGIFPGIYKT